MKKYIYLNFKLIIIILGIILLNYSYGYDARFTYINLLWILINVIKIK